MTAVSNPAKERLAQGAVSPGIGVRGVRGVEIARMMKTAGFDWLFIDLEHGQSSVETAYAISVAALDAGIAPIVRVPSGELALAARCLDGGALGIVVPHVDTAEEARTIVRKLRYPPHGTRSVAGGYPQLQFRAVPPGEAVAAMEPATLLVAMVETPRAVENAEAIAAVPGIDILLMGTNDLCLEMGIPGQLADPRVEAAVKTVVAACKKHNKWAGIGGVYVRDLMKKYIGLGMRFILSGTDLNLLVAASTEQASFVRSCN